MKKGLVPFANDLGSLANDLCDLAEDPLVLPHDPCVSAADLGFPVDETSSLAVALFVLAKARRQPAKALFAVAKDL